MSPAYASYMNRIALIAHPLDYDSGNVGETKWSTRVTTESGCGSWLTKQVSAWSIRTSSAENPSPSLPAFDDTAAAADDPTAEAAARGPDRPPVLQHAVKLSPGLILSDLLTMAKKPWTEVETDQSQFEILLSGSPVLKSVVQGVYSGYDCTDCTSSITEEHWTSQTWDLFVFALAEATLAKTSGVQQLVRYGSAANAQQHSAADDAGRARVVQKCAASTESELKASLRALAHFKALMITAVPDYTTPAALTAVSADQLAALYEAMLWFDLNTIPSAGEDRIDPLYGLGFDILHDLSAEGLLKRDVVAITANGVHPVDVNASAEEFQLAIENTSDTATGSMIKRVGRKRREIVAKAGEGAMMSPESKQRVLQMVEKEYTGIKARRHLSMLQTDSRIDPDPQPKKGKTSDEKEDDEEPEVDEERTYQGMLGRNGTSPSMITSLIDMGSQGELLSKRRAVMQLLMGAFAAASTSGQGWQNQIANLRDYADDDSGLASALVLVDKILKESGATQEQVSALVTAYPRESGTEEKQELAVLRFELQQARTTAIATLLGSRPTPGHHQQAPADNQAATGAAAQIYAHAGAVDEIAKRNRVDPKTHGDMAALNLAAERIAQRNPPPLLGGPSEVELEYASMNKMDPLEVRTHMATEPFTRALPEMNALYLSHISKGQIGEHPKLAWLYAAQQGAALSLSHYVTTHGLSDLNKPDLKKQTAMVYGDFGSVHATIGLSDFNSGDMEPFMSEAAILGSQFTKACKHMIAVLTMLHPTLLRADLEAETDQMQQNLEVGISLAAKGQPGVGGPIVLQHNINMVDAFLRDLSRLNDRARILDSGVCNGPVTVRQVVELSSTRGPGVPDWQVSALVPIFSLMKSAIATKIRKASEAVACATMFPDSPHTPTTLEQLPKIPKKSAAVLKKEKAAAAAAAAAALAATPGAGIKMLDVARPMGRYMAFQVFCVTVTDAQGKCIKLTQAQRKNLCLNESHPTGCGKCEYGVSCGTCKKTHISGEAADAFATPQMAKVTSNLAEFETQFAAGGKPNLGTPHPTSGKKCGSMETFKPLPTPSVPGKVGGKGGGKKGGKGRGGGP